MTAVEPIPTSALPQRATTFVLEPTQTTPSFRITKAQKSYHHQYSNIYYHRLKNLRVFVEEKARQLWEKVPGNPSLVPKVLEVTKSKLCYIVGTAYLDMPLKPNVLEDIARDQSILPPPPLSKFYSIEDSVMLEDESGRIKLVGERIKATQLVTGVVMGVLGMETPNGEFEVIDVCFPGLAPALESPDDEEEDAMDVDDQSSSTPDDEWIAVVSGLSLGAPTHHDTPLEMMVEFLAGEEGGPADQLLAAQISRLIIAGNTLAQVQVQQIVVKADEKKLRGRYGHDLSTFSSNPTSLLASHLQDIGSVMPIHILPGGSDPSGVILPQQPFPRAMMGPVSALPSFSCETNPTYIRLGAGSENEGGKKPISRTILVNAGQPLNDMFKYLASPPATRLSVLEATLKWRHIAPSAPDTLWCHPYSTFDPFLMEGTPDVYLVGGQKRFGTKLVTSEDGRTRCRIVMIPEFSTTGTLVLVNLRTLQVATRSFRARDPPKLKAEMEV